MVDGMDKLDGVSPIFEYALPALHLFSQVFV